VLQTGEENSVIAADTEHN